MMEGLVLFNSVSLYGMERAVMENFELLAPQVRVHYLLSQTIRRTRLPLWKEVQSRQLPHSFLSDHQSWARIGRPRSLRQFFRIAWALFRGNIDSLKAARHRDFLYAPSANYLFLGILAAFLYRVTGRRVILQFHDLLAGPVPTLRWLGWLITDYVHCSDTGKRIVETHNPVVRNGRHHVTPNRSRLTPSSSDPVVEEAFSRGRNLLYFGQMTRHKGVDLLLQAYTLLAHNDSRLHLHLVGGVSEPDIAAQLDQMRKGPLGSRLHVWGYRHDIAAFLSLTDLHVHPSPPTRFLEAFGLAVAEAMNAGKPTVCFASGAVAELVDSGTTGLICETESAAALAQAIDTLMTSPELLVRMGRAARRRYEQYYCESIIRDRWRQVFELSERAA